ncbi:hypothetical protein AURDEDRAFT_176819 [Auricularia subglabra TFB-10046 SS5]|uniref:Uncharacterized protein n=1 Tax=Auricularia subglabra (strain TFB-10046 / SS5) TaxID=717982 RepID=J0D5Q3_AURST|nr:hypothetical protein AURDEDRAFT_176819 [Auricularia subglabra TFB-10046 SS5]
MSSTPPLEPLFLEPPADNLIDGIFAARVDIRPDGLPAWAYLLRYTGHDDDHEDYQEPSDLSPALLSRFWRSIEPHCTRASGLYPARWVVVPNQSYVDWGILNAALCEKQAFLERYQSFNSDVYEALLVARETFSLLGDHVPLAYASPNSSLRTRRTAPSVPPPFPLAHDVYPEPDLQAMLQDLLGSRPSPAA